MNFTANLIIYLGLFTLLFISSNHKNICFMVNFDCKNEVAAKIIKEYREYLFKVTALMFLLSLVVCELFSSVFYIGTVNALYVFIILLKYISCHNQIKKSALENAKSENIIASIFSFDIYDFYLNIALTLYNFYLFLKFKENSDVIFSNTLFVIPLTLFFLNLIIIFSVFLIKKAPDFNVKEVKLHLINMLWLTGFFTSTVFTFYECFIILGKLYFLCLFALFLIIEIFTAFLYIRYISAINKPYGFKVENEKITNGKVVEINLSGTRLFINFKNKKSYLLLTGFFIFTVVYAFLVYLFTI